MEMENKQILNDIFERVKLIKNTNRLLDILECIDDNLNEENYHDK